MPPLKVARSLTLTRRQTLLQLFCLFRVVYAESVEVSRTANFEFGGVFGSGGGGGGWCCFFYACFCEGVGGLAMSISIGVIRREDKAGNGKGSYKEGWRYGVREAREGKAR